MYYKKQKSNELPAHRSARKRFRLYCQLFGVGIALSTLTFLITSDQELLEKTTMILGFGSGVWILVDYESLALRPFYKKFILVASLFALYAFSIAYFLGRFADTFTYASAICMFTLLLVQWPVRIIYQIIFSREPKVDRLGKFADSVYSLILFGALIALPLLITAYFF